MNKEEIVQQVMNELQAKAATKASAPEAPAPSEYCVDPTAGGLTEFVASSPFGDTLGFVIANVDPALHETLKLDPKYRSIGVVTARSGACPHAMTADEAVKATNTEVVIFDIPNDTKGGGGHGCMIVFAAEDVSDARRAVEITINGLDWAFGGIAANANSFYEIQFTARAGQVISTFFGGELGKAWGLVNACPAGHGILLADAALKAADVRITAHGRPETGSHTNEFAIMFVGDSGAVKQAVCTARDVSFKVMRSLGPEPQFAGKPYY